MKKAEHIFHQALEIEDLEERSAYIEQACEGDRLLEGQVQRFIQLHLTADQHFPTDPGSTTLDIQTDVFATFASNEKPGTRIGQYKLLQIIGEGGFGVVWMAEQVAPVKRRVALKIIKLGMDTREIIARFEAERQALAMMDHPNIAKVFDAGATETGRPYFVMELVKGIPVTQYCDEHQLDTSQRLELFVDICSAIHHAHQKGIIHRDIKPSNVLVTLHGDRPVPKVIDFGIAKATQCELTEKTVFTRFEQFIGTPVYMSPEQAVLSGLDIDTRSDIYSLGVLLYELITGQTPFDSKSMLSSGYDEMRRIIKEEEPPKPSLRLKSSSPEECTILSRTHHTVPQRLCSIVKGELDWIVMKSMEKDRARRYETAHDLALDISNFLSNKTVMAAEPSYGYRFRKFAKRNQGVLSATLAMCILLVAGTSVSIWQAVIATRAKDSAQAAETAEKEQRILAEQNAQTAQAYAESLRLSAYVSDMSVALKAIQDGHLRQARVILNRHLPLPGQVDLRGFEWRYLWEKSKSQEVWKLDSFSAQEGHFGGIALSNASDMLAQTFNGDILLRNLPNGDPLHTLRNVSGPTMCFANGDGLFLAEHNEGLDFSIRLWDSSSWQEYPPLKGLSSPFICSEDGRTLIARGGNRMEVWDLETRAKLMTLPGGLRALDVRRIYNFLRQSIALTKDGNTLFIGSDKGSIHSWDLENGRRLPSIQTGIPDSIVDLTISETGMLVVGHYANTISLWDVETRQPIGDPIKDPMSWVSSVKISNDGSSLVSSSADHNIYLYELSNGIPVSPPTKLSGHGGEIWAMSMSENQKWMVTGSQHDSTLRLWDLSKLNVGRDQNEWSLPLAFEGRDQLVAWKDQQDLVQVDLEKLQESLPIPTQLPSGYDMKSLTHGPPAFQNLYHRLAQRRWLTSVNASGIDIWDLTQANSTTPAVRFADQGLSLRSTAFSKDGSLLAAASSIEGVRVWKTQDWNHSPQKLLPGFREPSHVQFSNDATQLVVVNRSGGKLISLDNGEIIFNLDLHDQSVGPIAFSEDDQFLAIGTFQNFIHVWNLENKSKIHQVKGHVAGIRGLCFSPDGKTLVSCADSRVKLWNLHLGRELFTIHHASAEPSWPMFSSDGRWLVTGSSRPGLSFFKAPSMEEIKQRDTKPTF